MPNYRKAALEWSTLSRLLSGCDRFGPGSVPMVLGTKQSSTRSTGSGVKTSLVGAAVIQPRGQQFNRHLAVECLLLEVSN